MSFKLGKQTQAGEYGKKFKPQIKLENFINLYTGEWILDKRIEEDENYFNSLIKEIN